MKPMTPTHNFPRFETLLWASGALLALFVAYGTLGSITPAEETPAKSTPIFANAFASVRLAATAAYVVDLTDGSVLYRKNPELQLPLASLTKLMLTAVAANLIDRTHSITLTKRDLAVDGDNGLKAGEEWDPAKLLSLTLLASSNDGATALATALGGFTEAAASGTPSGEAAFVTQMNAEAKRLGLAQTYFLNPTGLDVNTGISGSYGSARDVAVLLSHLVATHPKLLAATQEPELYFRSQSGLLHKNENTDPLVASVPGMLASKTGYTDLAGGNLALAFDAGLGHPIVAVVLGSTYEGRFSDLQTLIDATMQNIAQAGVLPHP